MTYIDDKISEVYKIVKQAESIYKTASDKYDGIKYGKDLIDLSNRLMKIANNDITIDDLRNFLYKKGDSNMNKDVFIKTAKVLRALANHVNKETIKKESSAKSLIKEKLSSLGVDIDEAKIGKIAKDQDIVDLFNKISFDKAPSVGAKDDSYSSDSGSNADERFLKWLGL